MSSKIPQLPPSAITPEALFWNRRRFMQMAAGSVAALAAPACLGRDEPVPAAASTSAPDLSATHMRDGRQDFAAGEALNSYDDITSYNNFYEFGTGKSDPARHAHKLITKPWRITVDGACEAGGEFDLHELLDEIETEQRIYRLRCVEAWSMVVPWTGFELGSFLARFAPTDKARYVAFETAVRPEQMRLNSASVDWPYREGLRMDEAMHPPTFMATGLYGKPLPPQNGAPMRLVVPWKYGFKSIKSIVRIHFTQREPKTTWNMLQPREYGFYANVNPKVDHPRWSQARERRIGELFKRDTLMFNGYAEHVAGLYDGMDLRKHY